MTQPLCHWCMTGIRETTEATMAAAYEAGATYWKRNHPANATREDLKSVARSCGWHGEDNVAWLAGFYGSKMVIVEVSGGVADVTICPPDVEVIIIDYDNK